MSDDDGDRDPCVIACQGRPVCDLQGDDAIKAQKAGCPWCRRAWQHPDGSETVIEPTHQ